MLREYQLKLHQQMFLLRSQLMDNLLQYMLLQYLLVLVNKSAIETDDFKNICYPLVLAGWQHGADVNPQLYTKGEWDKRRFTPYFDNVEHDKLVIYES